jgi:hypothetical protein
VREKAEPGVLRPRAVHLALAADAFAREATRPGLGSVQGLAEGRGGASGCDRAPGGLRSLDLRSRLQGTVIACSEVGKPKEKVMSTMMWVVLIVVALFVFGGGGYYWRRSHRTLA